MGILKYSIFQIRILNIFKKSNKLGLMKSVSSLKPHDVALLLKILSKGKSDWKQLDIALELKISQGEVAKSLVRLRKSGFLSAKRVNRSAVIEFLIHGLKYVFPADVGALAVGVPTAISSKSRHSLNKISFKKLCTFFGEVHALL